MEKGWRRVEILLCNGLIEGSAPHGGQTSNSFGGVVAFSHQMGSHLAPWLVKLKCGVLHTPPSISSRVPVALGHLIRALQAPWLVQVWVKRTIKWLLACLCVLFVYGFVCCLYINHHGTPTGRFPESFVKT